MRGTLTLALLGAFQVALFWLFQFEVPESNRDLVVYMLGNLSGFAAAGVHHYLGTSKSSTDKNDMLRPPPPDQMNDGGGDNRPLGQGRDLPRPEFGSEEQEPMR